MYNLYKEYLESEETDLEYFDWLDNQILLRSRDRKIKEANQKAEKEKKKAEKEKKKAEEANQRAEKVNNEIDSILDETKESIIKYIKMQFHEDILWYNTKRIKKSLNYMSPSEYRQNLNLA